MAAMPSIWSERSSRCGVQSAVAARKRSGSRLAPFNFGEALAPSCTRDMADHQPPAPPHPRVVKFRSRLASVEACVDMYAVPQP